MHSDLAPSNLLFCDLTAKPVALFLRVSQTTYPLRGRTPLPLVLSVPACCACPIHGDWHKGVLLVIDVNHADGRPHRTGGSMQIEVLVVSGLEIIGVIKGHSSCVIVDHTLEQYASVW